MSDALRRPACSILLGCLIWAAVPLFISATGGFSAPFLFCFFLRAGGSLAALSFVLSRPRTSLCLRCLVSPRLVCLALGKLVYGFMAWSMAFIPPQVGVLAHGTWPMIFVLGLTGLRRESLPALGLMAVCLAGFALMTLSGGVPGLPYSRGTLGGGWLWPGPPPFSTAPTTPFPSGGADPWTGPGTSASRSWSISWASSAASPSAWGWRCSGGSFFPSPRGPWRSCAASWSAGWDILFRRANAVASGPGVNGLIYLTPALSVPMLIPVTGFDGSGFGYTMLGCLLVVGGNLAIHFRGSPPGEGRD